MQKKINFAKDHPLIIHVQVGLNHACCLKEKAIIHFLIGSIDYNKKSKSFSVSHIAN
jgi:hypothetical protein